MTRKSRSMVSLLLCLISMALIHAQSQKRQTRKKNCNKDGTLCVKVALEQSVIQNPLYFEVQVKCTRQIILRWELRDDSGNLLDQDSDGTLAFLVDKNSASERTLAVRDFALAPGKASHGKLVLRATTYTAGSADHALPELSIPVGIDSRSTNVTYAVPANEKFSEAVTDSVESDPAHRVTIRAEVDWRTTALLYVQPAMLGGAAAEAAARADPGQGPWHVINYIKAQGTAHLTIHGDGWAGVTDYLTGLDYLLERTVERQPGVHRVVYDSPPDFGL